MKIFNTAREMNDFSLANKDKTIGFVATMGCLHEGHLSLIKRAKAENDICVISIYVNPTQFAPNEDFEKYPRVFDIDKQLSEKAGADVIFYPTNTEMYPDGYNTYVEVFDITNELCGESRPGHFRGVTTIVNKLLNIVMPDNAYFGEKDAQQLMVIQKMVSELNQNVNIIGCPIIREEDGLAKSSRNRYLTRDERCRATILYKSLVYAGELIDAGELNTSILKDKIISMLNESKGNIDYVEIVDRNNLQPISKIGGKVLIALAVYFGNTRLIDNVFIDL